MKEILGIPVAEVVTEDMIQSTVVYHPNENAYGSITKFESRSGSPQKFDASLRMSANLERRSSLERRHSVGSAAKASSRRNSQSSLTSNSFDKSNLSKSLSTGKLSQAISVPIIDPAAAQLIYNSQFSGLQVLNTIKSILTRYTTHYYIYSLMDHLV